MVREVSPEVFLIAAPTLNEEDISAYLTEVGGEEWGEKRLGFPWVREGDNLIEFAGRLCYRSWKPGLNPNVSKVRSDQDGYLANIISVKHGSVLEHANYSFIFHNVSRVLTHELVRHRAGSAFSQESMRFVRLTDIPFWFPEWAREDDDLMREARVVLASLEMFQGWLAAHFELDEPGVSFAEKKAKTSFMRRFAPEGVATGIVWTANVRTIRWVLQARTEPSAEEEIRLVFDKVGTIMAQKCPALFADFERTKDGQWKTEHGKV